MRFGHFFYPMNFDPSRDSQTLDDCLYEAELVEELGLDAIWFAEHHFTGEVVYGDPLLFGSAVAMKTKRVLLGLGIVEMALHHPVRLAIQTALLDNLSHGRLVVGTGRGSNFSSFEYAGFGTEVSTGWEQIEEAEDLLVKAWTVDGLRYEGQYWNVTVPAVRPKPYQKPHPPLARAALSDESIIAMGRIGRPLLLRGRSTEHLGQSIELYRKTMLESGFDENAVERALDEAWVWRECYVAETDQQALEEFIPVYEKAYGTMVDLRERWNPTDQPVPRQVPPLPISAYGTHPELSASEVMVGCPRRVSEQVAQLRDVGVRNLMLTHRGLVTRQQADSSLRLLSEKVAPLFR